MVQNARNGNKPAFRHRLVVVLQFCRNFIELTLLLSVAWWWLLPYYGYAIAQLSAGVLLNGLDVPIEAARIDPNGILNTESALVFVLDGHELRLAVALLITNMAPYLALVLATPGLRVVRRLVILVAGAAVLFGGHVAFIVLALYFREAIAAAPHIPHAIAQFYLTLPFLLWIVLAYW
ncbi:MAG TPA: hypothetical protein PKL84_15900, partial [Candidatus Hydrogenedentes bacterium]|nr:hypothetical protein [Candidatus Hydrogenedentota bacterium]